MATWSDWKQAREYRQGLHRRWNHKLIRYRKIWIPLSKALHDNANCMRQRKRENSALCHWLSMLTHTARIRGSERGLKLPSFLVRWTRRLDALTIKKSELQQLIVVTCYGYAYTYVFREFAMVPLQTISPAAADRRLQHPAITASAAAREPQNPPAYADTFTPSSSSRLLGYDYEKPRMSIASTAKMQP
jgi:hypothetical protein